MRILFALLVLGIFHTPIFWSYCYAGNPSPYPLIRMGQTPDDRYVVVEMSKADYNADRDKVVFTEAADGLRRMLAEIKFKHSGSADPEPLPPEALNEVFMEVNAAIEKLYVEQKENEAEYIREQSLRKDTDAGPRPAYYGMDSSFGLNSDWTAPTAYFVTVSLKNLLKLFRKTKQADRELTEDAAVTVAQVAAGGPAGAAAKKVVGAGGDVQVGVIIVPIWVKLIPKDPHSGLPEKQAWYRDWEPIIMPYFDAHLGYRISSSDTIKPSFGFVWGDIKWGYEFRGDMYSFSYDLDIGWRHKKAPTTAFGKWIAHKGVNFKPGCLDHPRLDRGQSSLLPWCDFFFTMVRFQRRDTDLSKREETRIPWVNWRVPVNILAQFEIRGNLGWAQTGASAIRTILTAANRDEKTVQKVLDALSFMIDDDPTATIDVEDLDPDQLKLIRQQLIMAPQQQQVATPAPAQVPTSACVNATQASCPD